jgi:ABC-type cobalt transport system substrate-binding protein
MKTSGNGTRIWLVFFLLSLCPIYALATEKSEKWPGVDESVVEKIAKEHGREAREPIINTDQGDLLLFVFLLAGAAGGFAAGYYWRRLVTEKTSLPCRTAGRDGKEGREATQETLH